MEVQQQGHGLPYRVWLDGQGWRAGLLRPRQRCGLRHGARQKTVRPLPETSHRRRVSGDWDRTRHCPADRPPSRGPNLGRSSRRCRSNLLFHAPLEGDRRPDMSKALLLVEDNPTDEKLTVRAFKKCGVENEIVVVRDGAEALDYLFGTGKHAGRN